MVKVKTIVSNRYWHQCWYHKKTGAPKSTSLL